MERQYWQEKIPGVPTDKKTAEFSRFIEFFPIAKHRMTNVDYRCIFFLTAYRTQSWKIRKNGFMNDSYYLRHFLRKK
jgi:hypothetical protein